MATTFLWVRATRADRLVPMEGAPRRRIGPEPVRVQRSAYYLRQVRDGDLEIVDPPAPTTAARPAPRPVAAAEEA